MSRALIAARSAAGMCFAASMRKPETPSDRRSLR
ncbi:Uncharacterised protein [Mycobacteroides abscessus]|nr:Uncharacterised protein [Mycobacteroides abscessus]